MKLGCRKSFQDNTGFMEGVRHKGFAWLDKGFRGLRKRFIGFFTMLQRFWVRGFGLQVVGFGVWTS